MIYCGYAELDAHRNIGNLSQASLDKRPSQIQLPVVANDGDDTVFGIAVAGEFYASLFCEVFSFR